MATTTKTYTISRKISDTEEEEVKVPSSAVSGLATVATSGSYNDLADKPSIPDISGKANLAGGNAWTGNQQFNQGGYWFATDANHPFIVELENGDELIKVNPNGVSFDSDGLGTMPFRLNGDAGTSGQVLMSRGSGVTPIWGDISTPVPDLSEYQTRADSGLATADKTVVGAINEINSRFSDDEGGEGKEVDNAKNVTRTIGGLAIEKYALKTDIPEKVTSINGLSGGTVNGSITSTGSVTVGGNLTVNGTTTTVDSTTLQVKDKLIEVAHGNTTKLTTPAGLVAPKYDGTNSGALVFDGDGTAYVGDVTLDSNGSIDVSKSGLQPLATRTGLVGGNLVQYDSSALTLKDAGKKIDDLATVAQLNTKLTGTKFTNADGTTPSFDTYLPYSESAAGAHNTSPAYLLSFINDNAKNGLTYTSTLEALNATNAFKTYTRSPSHKPSQCLQNGFYYVQSSINSLTDADGNPFLQYHSSNNDFRILTTAYSDDWVQQIATDFRTANVYIRRRHEGTWQPWARLAYASEIPIVGNGTLMIQKNSETVAIFSANQGKDSIANISVPEVVQSTGGSTVNVMSQKAITDELGDYVDKSTTQEIGGEKTFTGTVKVKLINGGGGNSLIQQTDASGSAITVGSTRCPMQIQGNGVRPTYRQGTGSYSKMALQSDVVGSTAYGTCATAAGTAAKVVTIANTNWTLVVGAIIGVKFTNSNTASNVTLNVNGSGAKNIYFNNAKYTGTDNKVCGVANRLNYYMYDGTYWVWLNYSTEGDTIPSGMSRTGSTIAAKAVTCHNYNLLAKSYLQVVMIYANTAQGALTLNVNGKGAKPIYINGVASSASNYTLPAGSYLTYYDGTNYYFRTDGKLTSAGSEVMTKANFSLSGTTLTITL